MIYRGGVVAQVVRACALNSKVAGLIPAWATLNYALFRKKQGRKIMIYSPHQDGEED